MDTGYVSDRPGKSPMGMDLVPVYAGEGETVTGDAVRIDPRTIQNMGLRTERIRRGPLVKIIRTLGRVDYDEQRVVFVDTKFSGWIRTLHVDKTGQPVAAGQPLFAIYSPQLFQAQQEFVSAIEKLPELEKSPLADARDDARKMVEAARAKLALYDISADQIDALAVSMQPSQTMTIVSPAGGIVTDKMALQGMAVKPGMRLYTIADLSRIWVYLDIYEYQLPWIKVGQDAIMTLAYLPGKVFRGKVIYIYPYLEKETRVIKVRLEFDNPTLELKPEMYANVVLAARLRDDAVLVPREAYLDSGTRKVVFVDRGGGKFEPRDIQVGVEGEGGRVEVLAGLDEGDVVVTSGQFLLDAESKLQEAIAKMMKAKRAPVKRAGGPVTRRSPTPGGDGAPVDSDIPPDAAYACPMDKHPAETDPARQGAYFATEPGDCPWCGMKLAPIEALAWVQVRKAAAGADVAYTCPDHQHVFSDEPGKCPRCNGALAPFKVLYTCAKSKHSGVVSLSQDDCRRCDEPMAAFRGPWLGEKMAAANVPPSEAVASVAAYRCPMHPLVHGDAPANCTICGLPLQPSAAKTVAVPADAVYACPMAECKHISATDERCPVCGMFVKPIDEVPWAAAVVAARDAAPTAGAKDTDRFVCPMHPEVTREASGTCRICAMRLVPRESVVGLQAGPIAVRRQMDFLMEHYLGLHELFSADTTRDAARHALGLVGASESLSEALGAADAAYPPEVLAASRKLHDAAVEAGGSDLVVSRARFAEMGGAMRTLLGHIRPDAGRWPTLFVYHCPMSKADWIQTRKKKANPFYGFKMLDCGNLIEER